MQNIFVYFHLNAVTNKVFYVGIGVKLRPYRKSGRSQLWNRVVDKHGYKIEIAHTFNSWEAAKEKEIEYIKFFGRIDKGTGILVNHTDGGDGTLGGVFNVGRKASEETKAKQSAMLKGKPLHPNTIAARALVSLKGRVRGPMTEDQKLKISISKKGNSFLTEDHKAKISAKLKGRVFSEETKRKNSEALIGRVFSEDHKRKLSEAAKKQWISGNTWVNK